MAVVLVSEAIPKEIFYCQYRNIVRWKCELREYLRIRCSEMLEGSAAAHGTLWIFGSLVDSAAWHTAFRDEGSHKLV